MRLGLIFSLQRGFEIRKTKVATLRCRISGPPCLFCAFYGLRPAVFTYITKTKWLNSGQQARQPALCRREKPQLFRSQS